MTRWFRLCLGSALFAASMIPASACGPFLFANSELDTLSLIDPGIVGDDSLSPFYLYASPGYGFGNSYAQLVIHPDRTTVATSYFETNLYDEYGTGDDPVWIAANVADWHGYLRSDNGARYSSTQIGAILNGQLPQDLRPDDRAYFQLLFSAPNSDSGLGETALKRAKERGLSLFLRQRYAYLAIRAAAENDQTTPDYVQIYNEFRPLFAGGGLIATRALSWRAMDPSLPVSQQIDDYLTVWEREPGLRVLSYSSLAVFSEADWSSYLAQNLSPGRRELALYVHFQLEDRDFSPETLNSLVDADPTSAMALSALYRMTEMVEQEASTSRLLALTFDPAAWQPSDGSFESDRSAVADLLQQHLYTGLVDAAERAGLRPGIRDPRAWLTLASYLAFYDGDIVRMKALFETSLQFPAANKSQEDQSHLVGTMIDMLQQRGGAWNADLEQRIIQDLSWARTLNVSGHNRGLYHSLIVLVAEKDLTLDRRDAAARAFGALQTGDSLNPFELRTYDNFWAMMWGSNDPLNLLIDVLMRDQDIEQWRQFLHESSANRDPLDGWIASTPFLREGDLDYLQAYDDLRRDNPADALPIVSALEASGYFTGDRTWANNTSVFPVRSFGYSLDVDPVHPGTGVGMRRVGLPELARAMERADAGDPTVRGVFWFSLQLSGFPLLFADPPQVIKFVHDWQFYQYDDGALSLESDPKQPVSAVAVYPLFAPERVGSFREALRSFERSQFSAVDRSVAAFRQGAIQGSSPQSRALSWIMIAELTGDRRVLTHLRDPLLNSTLVVRNLRSNCETLRSYL